MRDQLLKNKRFGVVFGAGATKDLKFPSWNELIATIAANPAVSASAADYGKGAQSSVTQRLFHRFKERATAKLERGFDQFDRLASHLQAQWNDIIRDSLYAKIPTDTKQLMRRDQYLKDFLPVIRKTRLTVNYNFDDTIERFLGETRPEDERKTRRGFRTVWTADVQLYAQNAVIYHPNGYLPSVRSERPSDQLIFLEDSFGDQLIESASGHYSLLSYHFAQNTCLFIGLSLDDATLKHLLRKNALLHPGHVHYFVHFMSQPDALTAEQKREIREANFEVYNLVTLFLTREEIAALGRLLSYADDDIEIKALAQELGCRTHYYYFLTGSVCVGKSTAVSFFRSLFTHDEWLERKLEGMEQDPTKLAQKKKLQDIDEWVVSQWKQKNDVLRNTTPGLHIVDRSPLDAFAFTPEDAWVEKADFTKQHVTPGDQNTLVQGQVLLLRGDPNVMAVRALRLQKKMSREDLDYRQALLKVTFDESGPIDGIQEIDTCEKSAPRVAKEICRIIHMSDYRPCDLSARLEYIRSGKLTGIRAKAQKLFILPTTTKAIYPRKKTAKPRKR